MTDTIETFVKKLQAEGVATGKTRAEELVADARREAESILAGARSEAERIVGAARAEAKRLADAQLQELRLAARDALLSLRAAILSTVTAALRHRASAELKDGAFLRTLIQDVVTQYAAAAAEGKTSIHVAIHDETFHAVADWGLERAVVELEGGLRQAGFEYRVGASTVEVTPEAVVELLRERVSARLHQMLAEATPS